MTLVSDLCAGAEECCYIYICKNVVHVARNFLISIFLVLIRLVALYVVAIISEEIKMEVLLSAEMLVVTYSTTRHHSTKYRSSCTYIVFILK